MAPLPSAAKKVLSSKEVAVCIDCSTKNLWRMVREGKFPPPVYIQGRARWPLKDVECYLYLLGRGLFGARPAEPMEETED